MAPVWIVIIVVTLVIAAMWVQLRRTAPAIAPDAMRKSSRPAQPRVTAGPPKLERTALPELDWGNPVDDVARKHGDGRRPGKLAVPTADVLETQRVRIRGRYLAARFPGVAKSAADLLEIERMIQSARLYFEERKSDRAIELLDLAIAQCPADESMPLARLEIAFLIRDAALYVALAADFRTAHPSSSQWAEVARLGRAIAPEEAAFGTAGSPASDHYGPWPDMPNWIQAPWDLTAEVRATEFHQAMARRAA